MRNVRLADTSFPLDEPGVAATTLRHVVEHVLGPCQLFLAPYRGIQLGRPRLATAWRREHDARRRGRHGSTHETPL